ncbi:2-oxoacid:acceptor oxidoreductase family protein, partial [Pyrobaculum aerophilum]
MYEVIFLGRGGQGAVTAAQLLAYAAALEGKKAQALPEFGAERRGAIVRAYLRIGEALLHSSIKRADYVVVLD